MQEVMLWALAHSVLGGSGGMLLPQENFEFYTF